MTLNQTFIHSFISTINIDIDIGLTYFWVIVPVQKLECKAELRLVLRNMLIYIDIDVRSILFWDISYRVAYILNIAQL